MLSSNLVGLTSEREVMFDPSSYGQRSTDSARLPGVLVDDFSLTLSGRPREQRCSDRRAAATARARPRAAEEHR